MCGVDDSPRSAKVAYSYDCGYETNTFEWTTEAWICQAVVTITLVWMRLEVQYMSVGAVGIKVLKIFRI